MQLELYEKYINLNNADPLKDGLGYSQAFIYANDDEFMALINTIKEAILKVAKNKPSQSRKARVLSTIIIPQNWGAK